MEEWKEYKIKDICKGIYEGPHATPKESQTGGIYLGIPAISIDGHINFRNAKRIAEEDLPLWTKRVTPQEDDIVFTNEATLNLYALISAGFHGCLGRRLGLVRPNKELVNAKFLFYYFFSPEWRNVISQNKVYGATVERILMTKFPSFPIKLPSLPIQNKIVNILSSFDDKIEVNRRINENLEQQAQALFKSCFVDFEPFRDGEFVESELGMIPKGWRVGTFLENIKVMPGGTPSTSKNEYWDGGTIPFFSPKDVNGVYCFETEKHITELGLNNCSSHLYPPNTLFITARGTVGKLALAGVPMAMNQSNYALVAKEGTSKFYLFLLAQTLVSILLKKANGAVFSAITTRDFNEPTIIPTNSVMDKFDKLISPLFNKIYKTSCESRRLAELRDTLLPKLMSGELKVNEIKA